MYSLRLLTCILLTAILFTGCSSGEKKSTDGRTGPKKTSSSLNTDASGNRAGKKHATGKSSHKKDKDNNVLSKSGPSTKKDQPEKTRLNPEKSSDHGDFQTEDTPSEIDSHFNPSTEGTDFSAEFSGIAPASDSNIGDTWEKISVKTGGPFKKRTFSDIMIDQGDTVGEGYRHYPRIMVDNAYAKKYGLNVLRGKRLVLVTDLPITPDVALLPDVMDRAFSILCRFFKQDESELKDWHVTTFLMKNNTPFMSAGYLPHILPPFQNGYSFNYDCWVYEQHSPYYRTHLIIHEAVHSFMNTTLGHSGPTWYMEGLAELLGTHQYITADGKSYVAEGKLDSRCEKELTQDGLSLGVLPLSRQSAPYWGRIKTIKECAAQGKLLTLEEALNITLKDMANNNGYVWCWALAWFLDQNPVTRDAFRALPTRLSGSNAIPREKFTQAFLKDLKKNMPELEIQWILFLKDLDYGYKLRPVLLDPTPGVRLGSGEKKVLNISAQRGWQNSGVAVRHSENIRVRANGRFMLSVSDGIKLPCEPNGITLNYYQGKPVGILEAAVYPNLEKVFSVGTEGTFSVPSEGTLMFRINDAPGNLDENEGSFSIEITDLP